MALDFPPIYLLSFNIPLGQLHELELQIGKSLTYDIREAKVVLGKVNTKQRAQFELRSRKLWTLEVKGEDGQDGNSEPLDVVPARKRRRVGRNEHGKEVIELDSSSESEAEADSEKTAKSTRVSQQVSSPAQNVSSLGAPEQPSAATAIGSQKEIDWGDTIKVLKLAWFTDSLMAGALRPLKDYMVYEARPVPGPEVVAAEPKMTKIPRSADILARAKTDAQTTGPAAPLLKRGGRFHRQTTKPISSLPRLTHESTSEYDSRSKLPPVPSYLHTPYSCQRPTPFHSPNDDFISKLKKIRGARLLTGDDIGVRAYSTSIASLAAYPYTLSSTQEVLGLPGCDQKIASIYQQWKETGHIQEVDEIESDARMKVLDVFYEIWGVGAVTAREFYNKGWRSLDDVVEYGWGTLSRVQQIGVKFYDELQEKIPRAEVETIGEKVLQHANMLIDGFQMVIVGGHRRGQASSGDVDVILSHPNEKATLGFIGNIVASLEKGEWITHTLTLAMTNSERGQTPVSWKGDKARPRSGFDTLDKALVVWQDPEWPSKAEDLRANPRTKNPNIHRRVDIIISPWRTAGCAVLGWSGGTTFQRDLRRYCKHVKKFKFDSSGVRSNEDGRWISLEEGEPGDMVAKERRVFSELGLEWREPTERCTG